MRILDWKPRFDERSRGYSIRSLVGPPVPARRRMWRQGTVLDQGTEGACVGFGWMGSYLAAPKAASPQPDANAGARVALDVYSRAKKIDEFPGEDYSGTSVLAGAKIMQQDGRVSEYRWCFGIDDVRDAILTHGPVVIGVPWYEGMYETKGLVQISGQNVGGHCILLTGYDPALKFGGTPREVFRWRNSWGKSYGLNGSAFIQASDLARLLGEGGEACVPVKP